MTDTSAFTLSLFDNTALSSWNSHTLQAVTEPDETDPDDADDVDQDGEIPLPSTGYVARGNNFHLGGDRALEGVNIALRAKDTRARMVTRFKEGTFVYPGALFALTREERGAVRSVTGWVGPATSGDDEDGGAAAPEAGDEGYAGSGNDLPQRETA